MEKVKNLNGILDWITEVYRKNLWPIIGYVLLMQMAVGLAIQIISTVLYFIVMAVSMPLIIVGNEIIGGILMLGNYFVLIYVAIVLSQMVGTGLVQGTLAARAGRKIRFSDMFSYTFHKIWYVISSSVSYGLILGGIYILAAILFAGITFVIMPFENIWVFVVAYTILGLFIFAFGIWFFIRSMFYIPIAVIEKKHFFAAIRESFELTRGSTKKLFGYGMSFSLASLVIAYGLGGIAGIITTIFSLFANKMDEIMMVFAILFMYLIILVIYMLVIVLVAPIRFLFVPIVYLKERDEKYGNDLFEKLADLIHMEKEALKMEISNYDDSSNI